MAMLNRLIHHIATGAVLLSLVVVMLGAYTRLTDAGLGCPDWPGCYGHLVLPGNKASLATAQMSYPEIPIEPEKAWTEMAHRYLAGILGLLVFFLAGSLFRNRMRGFSVPWHLPLALVFLIIFQAILGMWTVTLKLLPVIVMAHLIGGILIVACLARLRVQLSSLKGQELPQWRFGLRLGFFIVLFQIALGGWVSSNYAGVSCIGFPTCNGMWWPELHFSQGFNLFSPVGANYQGGLLDHEVRVTIQFIHRVGALITAAYIIILAFLMLFKAQLRYLKVMAWLMLTLVVVQFILGILNVIYLLPLMVAVAHNGVAAFLLATVFSSLHFTRKEPNNAC